MAFPDFFESRKGGTATFPGLRAAENSGTVAFPAFWTRGKSGNVAFPSHSSVAEALRRFGRPRLSRMP